jgi:hypothetical protein
LFLFLLLCFFVFFLIFFFHFLFIFLFGERRKGKEERERGFHFDLLPQVNAPIFIVKETSLSFKKGESKCDAAGGYFNTQNHSCLTLFVLSEVCVKISKNSYGYSPSLSLLLSLSISISLSFYFNSQNHSCLILYEVCRHFQKILRVFSPPSLLTLPIYLSPFTLFLLGLLYLKKGGI